MAIKQVYLGWEKPALASAADYLCKRYARAGELDLSNVMVGLPGSRAGRRLLEIVVQQAQASKLIFTPPLITTTGAIPEQLYHPKHPFAEEAPQHLAWTAALRSLHRDHLTCIVAVPPPDDRPAQWLALGELISRLHLELAGEGIDFQQVAAIDWEAGQASSPAQREKARWEALAQAQRAYLHTLDQLSLWDRQTARLYAIKNRECRTDRDMVLIGTTDMNQAVRQMLDQVADRITTLIFAPESWGTRFDTHGCVDPQAWEQTAIELRDEQIRVVDGPTDQCRAVIETLASWNGQFRADQITIGVPDEGLIPYLQRQFAGASLPTRYVVGQRMAETPVFRLLETVAAYLDRHRFPEFASLARHPDIGRWLGQHKLPAEWLIQLDQYYALHLPTQLGDWRGRPASYALIKQAFDEITTSLKPLAEPPQSLTQWMDPIRQWLTTVYQGQAFDRRTESGHYALEAIQQVQSAISQLQRIPPGLAPTLSASDAIRMLLRSIETGGAAPMPDDQAIELLGWLELPLDDAPALIVTSMNEGIVPSSVNSDPFLPNSLRQRLGLFDNARRYARDAYALSALAASRPRFAVIAGRRNANKDPIIPSRLLFATGREQVARRAKQWFHSPEPLPPLAAPTRQATSRFVIPEPDASIPATEKLSVTAFRAYLACPYRYYLNHVLRLRAVDDDRAEMDAAAFGNLLHDVLSQFGQSEVKDSSSSNDIQAFLRDSLHTVAQGVFGNTHQAAIQIQLAQIERRLDAFSDWQARRAADGWRIKQIEWSSEKTPAILAIDERRSVQLDGRIDRIDWHSGTGQWMILDYKTGDSPSHPEKVHRRGDRWVDLQLPLYLQLAKGLEIDDSARLGYIVLPKDCSKVDALVASWTNSDFESAYEQARWVAGRILDRVFWPPAPPPAGFFREFAAICQEDALDRQIIERQIVDAGNDLGSLEDTGMSEGGR